MTSSIDTSLPIQGRPTTASVRSNFAYAKSEIESLQNKTAGIISVKDYGAVGNGTTDDSAAITAALAAAPIRSCVYFPAGNYACASPITFPNNILSYVGDGSRQSVLIYTGTDTTVDCFTFPEAGGVRLSGIGFSSNTTMTDGAGVRFVKNVRMVIHDVLFSHQDGNTNFYHGAWFDGFDFITINHFQAKAQQDGLRIAGNGAIAGVYASNFKIAGCTVGIHVGGSSGGIQFEQGDIINNKTNVVIDSTISGAANREIVFGSTVNIDSACSALDAATFDGINVDIDDSGGFVFFRNTWNASAGTCLRVTGSPTVLIDGGIIFNAVTTDGGTGHGIECNSATAKIVVNGTWFENCDTTGVYSSVSTTNIQLNNPFFAADVADAIGANVATTGKYTYQTNNQSITGRLIVGGELPYATCISGTPAGIVHGGNFGMQRWSNDANNPWLSLEHSRGTTQGTHVTVQTNDQLGGIAFAGSDGTAFRSAADIIATCSGSPSGNQTPGKLTFRTNAGSGVAGRWIIEDDGMLDPGADNAYDIGTAATARVRMIYSGNITLSPASSVTPANNGEVTFELTNNTTLTLKAKGSDGNVRAVALTLA